MIGKCDMGHFARDYTCVLYSDYSNRLFIQQAPFCSLMTARNNVYLQPRSCLSFVSYPSLALSRREKQAGERMTQFFRKAVVSIYMSPNREALTDMLPDPQRWHLSTLLCIITPQCLICDRYRKYSAYLLNSM